MSFYVVQVYDGEFLRKKMIFLLRNPSLKWYLPGLIAYENDGATFWSKAKIVSYPTYEWNSS